jgi:hypothetical protein
VPANGLRFTRAAPIDRDDDRADSRFQNRRDLARRAAASGASVKADVLLTQIADGF